METVGGGVFRPDVTDPEMSQACSTSLWELVLFRVWDLLLPVYIDTYGVCMSHVTSKLGVPKLIYYNLVAITLVKVFLCSILRYRISLISSRP